MGTQQKSSWKSRSQNSCWSLNCAGISWETAPEPPDLEMGVIETIFLLQSAQEMEQLSWFGWECRGFVPSPVFGVPPGHVEGLGLTWGARGGAGDLSWQTSPLPPKPGRFLGWGEQSSELWSISEPPAGQGVGEEQQFV